MRLFATILVLLALLGTAPPARAENASIVVDFETGDVLHALRPHAAHHPASLTKMMTVYLAFEAVADGALAFDTKLKPSLAARKQTGTRLGLRKGREIALKDAILAMIVRSANDASVVVAEAVSGSEEAFAKAMNDKARALGMARTRFVNATGLPAARQVTTARDMAVLARALLRDFPEHAALFAETSFRYRRRTYPTYNGFLKKYKGAEGLKTGFICSSGYNLAATARRDGRRLVGVVLGDLSGAERDWRMGRLFSAVFKGKAGPMGRIETLPASAKDLEAKPPNNRGKIDACVNGVTRKSASFRSTWGLDLGEFGKKSEARSFARRALSSLRRRLGGRGRAVALTRIRDGRVRHTAAIVGLSKKKAVAECRRLVERQAWCLTLSPEIISAILEIPASRLRKKR